MESGFFADRRRVLLYAWGLVVPSAVVNGYIGRPLSTMISGGVVDGWCDPANDGIGQHCFGDFADQYSRDPSSPWSWDHPISHPPVSLHIQGLFRTIGEITEDKQIALYLWLGLMTFCVLTPLLYLRRVEGRAYSAIDFLILGISSLPALFVLDRGNSLVLAVPAIMLTLSALRRGDERTVLLGIVFAALLRPQLALLVLLVAQNKGIRPLVKATLLILSGYVLSFLVYPGDRVENLKLWFQNVQEHQDYVDPYVLHSNFSFSRSIAFLVQILERFSVSVPQELRDLPNQMSLTVIAVPVLVVISYFVVRSFRLSLEERAAFAVLLCISVPQVSFGYYAVYLLPVCALFFLKRTNTLEITEQSPLLVRAYWILNQSILTAAMVCTLVPLTFSLSLFIPLDVYKGASLTQAFAAPLWHLYLVLLLVRLVVSQRIANVLASATTVTR